MPAQHKPPVEASRCNWTNSLAGCHVTSSSEHACGSKRLSRATHRSSSGLLLLLLLELLLLR